MATVFTKIISGEIPCYKVAESEYFQAFLDINPNAKGHTLCVPKKETNKIFELSDQEYSDLMLFCKKVAAAVEAVVPCKRVGMAAIGLEVPHVHVHLIPLNDMKEMTFQHKISMTSEEMAALAAQIQVSFNEQ